MGYGLRVMGYGLKVDDGWKKMNTEFSESDCIYTGVERNSQNIISGFSELCLLCTK